MRRSSKPLMIGVGLGVLGLIVLATKKASAASDEVVRPDVKPPSGIRTAKVNSVPGVNVRTAPLAPAPGVKGAPLVAANDAFVDTVVTVLETGIMGTQPAVSREWWRITTPGGSTGFASAVDAGGNKNLILQ